MTHTKTEREKTNYDYIKLNKICADKIILGPQKVDEYRELHDFRQTRKGHQRNLMSPELSKTPMKDIARPILLPSLGNNAAIAAAAASVSAKKPGHHSTLHSLSPLEIMDDKVYKIREPRFEESPLSSAHQTMFGKASRPSTPVKALISNTYGKMSDRFLREHASIQKDIKVSPGFDNSSKHKAESLAHSNCLLEYLHLLARLLLES